MKLVKILLASALILSTAACSFVFPQQANTIDPETVTVAEEPPSGTESTYVNLDMGAGQLNIEPGSSKLIEGTVRYNIAEWKPTVSRSSGSVTIKQESSGVTALPGSSIINEWKLKIGTAPIDLIINAGAYEGNMEFGGAAITSLEINDGASKNTVSFSEPNLAVLKNFTYKTGASDVEINGLGNANFSNLKFEGGAGSYTLDFSGELRQDGNVNFSGGVSSVTIIVPQGTNMKVVLTGELTDVQTTGKWSSENKTYTTSAEGPMVTIYVDLGVGSLKLVQK